MKKLLHRIIARYRRPSSVDLYNAYTQWAARQAQVPLRETRLA